MVGILSTNLAAWYFVSFASAAAGNQRPIIGILTQPMGIDFVASGAPENRTYIAASYVKFAESAGARVVPLHYDASDEELQALFGQINGIIFAGGGTEIRRQPNNRYRQAAQLLFQLALDSNAAGNTFPIHGTCLGFQMLGIIAAQNDSVLCKNCFKGVVGVPLPLSFTGSAKASQTFREMPPALFHALSSHNITENSHKDGITPESFEEVNALRAFFDILSTNLDSEGREFVSTFEARTFPFTGTQWHPEKTNFEWVGRDKTGCPHTLEAVQTSQYMANLLVDRARRNRNHFDTVVAESASLIYNYAPKIDPSGRFSQIYEFKRPVAEDMGYIFA